MFCWLACGASREFGTPEIWILSRLYPPGIATGYFDPTRTLNVRHQLVVELDVLVAVLAGAGGDGAAGVLVELAR